SEVAAAGADAYVLKGDPSDVLIGAIRSALATPRVIATAYNRRRGYALVDDVGGPQPLDTLTSREREVLQLLSEGRSNKEVASGLGITVKTAETHRARVMTKLNLHSMSELVRYAVRNHIIDP